MAAEARWLDEDEQRAWRSWIAATELVMSSLDTQLQRDAGLPHVYYVVLAMLSEAPERTLRMSELASATTTSPSRLSHAVAKLEQRGWVERRPCPSDRRGTLATLTDAGYAVLEQAAPGHVEAVRAAMFDRLSPQQVSQLEEICTALREGLSAGRGSRGAAS